MKKKKNDGSLRELQVHLEIVIRNVVLKSFPMG